MTRNILLPLNKWGHVQSHTLNVIKASIVHDCPSVEYSLDFVISTNIYGYPQVHFFT